MRRNRGERGDAAVEYMLVIAGMALAMSLSIPLFSFAVGAMLCSTVTQMQPTLPCDPSPAPAPHK